MSQPASFAVASVPLERYAWLGNRFPKFKCGGKMKCFYSLILFPCLFLYQIPARAEDCIQQAKKNCVDLCAVDPGNGLNRRTESRVKLSEDRIGSCTITNHGESYLGDKIRIKYRATYFEFCSDYRYEKI